MARIQQQLDYTITPEERKKLFVTKDKEKQMKLQEPHSEVPDGYWWDESGCLHNPMGHLLVGNRGAKSIVSTTKHDPESLQFQIEKVAGINCKKIVQKLYNIATSAKTSDSVAAQYCVKILEMYYGKATETKNINNNITVSVSDQMLDMHAKMLKQEEFNRKSLIDIN